MSGQVVRGGGPSVTGVHADGTDIEPTYLADPMGAPTDDFTVGEFTQPEVAYVYVDATEAAALGITGPMQPTWNPPLPNTPPADPTAPTYRLQGMEVYAGPDGGYWVRWWPDYSATALSYDQLFPPPSSLAVEWDESTMYLADQKRVSWAGNFNDICNTATVTRPGGAPNGAADFAGLGGWHFRHRLGWLRPQSPVGAVGGVVDYSYASVAMAPHLADRSQDGHVATDSQTGWQHSIVDPQSLDATGISWGKVAQCTLRAQARINYTLNGQQHVSSWATVDSLAPAAIPPRVTVEAFVVTNQEIEAFTGGGADVGLRVFPSESTASIPGGTNRDKLRCVVHFGASSKRNNIIGVDCGPVRTFQERFVSMFAPDSTSGNPVGVRQWCGSGGASLYANATHGPVIAGYWNALRAQDANWWGQQLATAAPAQVDLHVPGVAPTWVIKPTSPRNAPNGQPKTAYDSTIGPGTYFNVGQFVGWRDMYPTGPTWDPIQNARTNTYKGEAIFTTNGAFSFAAWRRAAGDPNMGTLLIHNGADTNGVLAMQLKATGVYGGEANFFSVVKAGTGVGGGTSVAGGTQTAAQTMEPAGQVHGGGNLNAQVTRHAPPSGVRPTTTGSNPGYYQSTATQRIGAVNVRWTSAPFNGAISSTRTVMVQVCSPGGAAPNDGDPRWRDLAWITATTPGAVAGAVDIGFPPQPPGSRFRIVAIGTGWRPSGGTSGPFFVVQQANWRTV